MKKAFILAISLLTAGVANSQTTTTSSTASSGAVKFGIKAGANFANIVKTGDDNFKTEFKPGFHAGIFVDIPVVDRLSFAPELLYSQKGYKTSGTSLLGGPYDYSVTTNFIDVPILAKINATPAFHITLGPQVSFLTSTTTKFKSANSQYQETIDEENKNLKKSLVGGVIGLGFDITNKVSINGRYALDLQKNNENGTSETPQYRNQVIQAGLAISF
ncbi:MAG: hypothetical protein JWN56_2424 [Sphingobacteriales bacterium]|nr:hypothetical protein [Sphingobacteriales bacterium]